MENPQQQQKREAAQIKQTLLTEGWDVLKKRLLDRRDQLNKELILENDINQFRTIQSDLRAIDRLFLLVESYSNVDIG